MKNMGPLSVGIRIGACAAAAFALFLFYNTAAIGQTTDKNFTKAGEGIDSDNWEYLGAGAYAGINFKF